LSKDKKAVFITGCSSGIGYHCAKRLKEEDIYRVIASARKEKDVEKLISEGFDTVKMDLSESNSIREGFDEVLQKSGGKLYALFNNAGFGQPGAVEDLSRTAFKEQFEVNLFGTVELGNLAIKLFREQNEGKIIQNSSVLGFVSFKYRGAYNASKFAIEAISDALRLELRGSGISVSLIEPGPIRSNFRKNAYEKFKKHIDIQNSYHRENYQKSIARFGSSEDDPFTLDSEAVYRALKKILKAKKPKARYQVTIPTKLFWILKRVLPVSLLDEVLDRI
jgi:short-subunit dehydrogenase